ncbi:hypothetical protein [Nocardioides deserti]|uniref:Uncharacterized protein n=1 Tax=Nocardioides deserti TaxID=1588644 RepID=A0ABR6U5R5_9ACTN|nr:hypothetical protein [Nocardioides deserti]MBC2959767.1 hypothetical protein [Nocardioides deserti]GGO74518.1 hypothetical protein GCM10012276_22730 [Nocardioides deserti]
MHTPFSYEAELQYRRDQVRTEVAAARRRKHPRTRFPQRTGGLHLPGVLTGSTA